MKVIYQSHPLTDRHDLANFDCGQEELNSWLVREALRAQRADIARTYVWCESEHDAALGYYSITPTHVTKQELPSRSLAGGYSIIPGYLLGKLALHRKLHGQQLGSQLLLDALRRIVKAAQHSGGRVVVVDAINDAAAAFYRHHNFVSVPDSQRLYLKIATVQAALQQ